MSRPLYEPLDFFVVRAPLLPIEAVSALRGSDARRTLSDEARAAIAVGSSSMGDALRSDGPGPRDGPDVVRALRRYLVRMSTRPTPFGLFAGTGLGTWGPRTDLTLATNGRTRRTRPDGSWLMAIVDRAEEMDEVRQHSRVVANGAAYVRAGRVILAERVSRGERPVPPAVSIRATGVVVRALEAARASVPYPELASLLVDETPGATAAKVDALLAVLCQQTLLLTDLRPPLTVASPARHVLERLTPIPEASELRAELQAVIDSAAEWDAAPAPSERTYRAITERAASVAPFERSPLQVDAALILHGHTVSRAVGLEAARAAELLLSMSSAPRGPRHLDAYRRLFEYRYGVHRAVPLLELLDTGVGLGPLPTAAVSGEDPRRGRLAQRARTLLDLATTALRDRIRCIDLDAPTLRRLQTDDLPALNIPLSLDLTVVVAATSKDALDAGDFELAIGPNVGSMGAGRMLGRFADFVPEAPAALGRIAASEAARAPGRVIAELVYAPRSPRLANVSTRLHNRPYEIAVGVTPSLDPSRTIRPDELLVGTRAGRFTLRWATTGEEVMITAGHMLTSARASPLCRFLSEIGRDGVCQLNGFQWGPASAFPFLPRVRSGRVVISLAQWRLAPGDIALSALDDLSVFRDALDRWRLRYDTPSQLVVAEGDRRLQLDMDDADDADEVRRMLRRDQRPIVLTEVFPAVGGAWVADVDGRRYMAELVVPLVGRVSLPEPAVRPASRRPRVDVRPPGSDWLFAKLYTAHDMEDDLLAGPVRQLADEAAALGFGEWFFIRYSDPARHLRLRFRGAPRRLHAELVPLVSDWATQLMATGECLRFAFDTYERELERFGGPGGTTAAELMFMADSAAVIDLIAARRPHAGILEPLPIAVLTVDAMLDGLGFDPHARAAWCGAHAVARQESGADYRTWKTLLRPLLTDPRSLRTSSEGAALTTALDQLRAAGAALRADFEQLHTGGVLSGNPADIARSIVHLHLNRLLGADSLTERRVLGLLSRLQAGLAVSGPPAQP